MEVLIKTRGGALTFKAVGDTQKALFQAIAGIQEIFDEPSCGMCASSNIRFRVRNSQSKSTGKKFTYHELICNDCHARLSFGENMEGGGLFPKRKGDSGYLPNRGWEKYAKDASNEETQGPPF